MRILNLGSVNIDHVYQVPHFVRPGETLASSRLDRFAGGKGFNQSIALARAGACVDHAGLIGPDGVWLREHLAREGVNTRHLHITEEPTGHAIIQVTPEGQNSIVLFGGANQRLSPEAAANVLSGYGPGDWLLLQNEISSLPAILTAATQRDMNIAFNPAPMTVDVLTYPLDAVDLLIVNEVEAAALLCGRQAAPEPTLQALRNRFPEADLLLTLGAAGAWVMAGDAPQAMPPRDVPVVDTTAAGDTMIGYYLASCTAGMTVRSSLHRATIAASLCVSRPGAFPSIPRAAEVDTITDFEG